MTTAKVKKKPLPKGLDRLPSGSIRVRVLNADGVQVTVGTYDWRDAAGEWALHRWMRENGATDGETVLVKLGAAT